MPISKVSSRDFNQHTSRAKKAARSGPVVITERGHPSHVLLTYEDYQELAGSEGGIIERLGMPAGVEDAKLEIPPRKDRARPADFR